MAHIFDIRFTRSSGLAALLEAPTNSFRWKGAGLLSIDAEGVNIALKRALPLRFRGLSRRISASRLTEVYREGVAVRLEFSTPEIPRAVVPLWASDGETAARIVELMPTTRTFELEDSSRAVGRRQSRLDIRWLAFLAAAAVVVISTAAYLWMPREKIPAASLIAQASRPSESETKPEAPTPAAPAPTTPAVATPDSAPAAGQTTGDGSLRSVAQVYVDSLDPRPATPNAGRSEPVKPRIPSAGLTAANNPPNAGETPAAQPGVVAPAAMEAAAVNPIPRNTRAYDVARGALARFDEDANTLVLAYQHDRDLFASGRLSRPELADKLKGYQEGWADVKHWLLAETHLDEPALTDLWSSMLGAAQHWRNFLALYENGLRGAQGERFQLALSLARLELAMAEDLQLRSRQYVPE